MRMGRIIRRRVRHAHWVGDGPVGLVERGDDFTRAEVDWFMRRLQRSQVSRFLTYDLQEESDGGFCLNLNGRVGDFYAGFGSDTLDVCFRGELVRFIEDSARDTYGYEDVYGDIIYNGPILGRPRAELLDLVCEAVRIFAGATSVSHDEVVDATRWHAPSFDQIRDSSYDVYVKNAHTAPYRKTFANISFHVNCDAPGKGD